MLGQHRPAAGTVGKLPTILARRRHGCSESSTIDVHSGESVAASLPFLYDVALLLTDQQQPKTWSRKLLPAGLADLERLGSITLREDEVSIRTVTEPSVAALRQLQTEILVIGNPVHIRKVVRRMRSKYPKWAGQIADDLVNRGLLDKKESTFLFVIKERCYSLSPASNAEVERFKAEVGQTAERVRAGGVPDAPSLMPLHLLGGMGLLAVALPATVGFGASDVTGSLNGLRDQLDPDTYGFAHWRKQLVTTGDGGDWDLSDSYDFGWDSPDSGSSDWGGDSVSDSGDRDAGGD